MDVTNHVPITRTQLIQDFRALGIREGQTVMMHASVKAVGGVMGGPDVILSVLIETLGRTGTLMMYAGWEDIPDYVSELPEEDQQTYFDEYPVFDPVTARAVRDHSILAEFLRTIPGTERSLNPEASMIAIGAQAGWITRDHPMNYGYGAGSPLAKLVEIKGQVLMLGAPLDTITLLHYAENRAKMRHKNTVQYSCPVMVEGQKVWVEIEDFDTGDHHDDYTFEQIALEYLAANRGRRGRIGNAESFLFDADDLADFAIRWLETHFG